MRIDPKKLLLLVLFFASCSPVKKVLQDPTKFDRVAREVVKRGYCLNDTTHRDTTYQYIVRDSLITDTFLLHAQHPIPILELDTLFPSGARVIISDLGQVSVNCPVKQVEKQIAVNHFIRDKKKEQLLQEDIDARDLLIGSINKARFQLQEKLSAKEDQIRDLRQRIRTRTMQLVALIALAAFFLGSKLLRIFKLP